MALSPSRLSYELRKSDAEDMQRRRWMIGLSYVGIGAGLVVGLYQTGILRRLPDLPFRPFDATKVDKAPYAYKRLQTPDALLMVASYAVTAILAGAGGKNRAKDNPALPIAMAAKALYDLGVALKLGQEEWRENRALCGYCQAATVASLVSVGVALPEAVKAVQHVVSGDFGEGRLRAQPRPRVTEEERERSRRQPKHYTRPLKGQQPVHAR